MAALERLFEHFKAPAPEAGAATSPAPAASAPPAEPKVRLDPLVPPWHVQNAKTLIAAAALLVAAVAAYLSYQAWQMYANPLNRIMTMQGEAESPTAPEPAAAVPAAAPARPGAAAAPSALLPAQPVASTTKPTASRATPAPAPVVAVPAPAVAPPAGPRPPAVTHTLRDPATVTGAAAAAPGPTPVPAPVPATVPAPAATPSECADGVAALGLCASQARKGGK